MKLSINKNTLESAIALCNAYADKKDASNITSHLLFEAKDDVLTIRASDYEFGLAYKLKKVSIENEGFATVHAKNIVDMIKNLDNEDITLETVENSLFIRQKSTKYKLNMFAYDEFPEFPSIEGREKLDIDSSDLSRSLKKILPAVDSNNPKMSLNGALLDIKSDKLNFVSTDTKRLAIYTLNKANSKEMALSIPKKAIMEMQKLFYEKIELFYGDNALLAVSENFKFFTKLINDKFPDYEKVIPKEIKQKFSFKTSEILECLKKISVVAEKMKLSFSKDKLIFEGMSLDNMEAKTELDIELNVSENFTLNIQVKHLIDFLNSIETEDFSFEINEPNLAFIVRSEELQTIVMPVIM